VIGTLRRECLDHLIVLDERHLRTVLTEFVQYYNQERPHRTLGLQTPQLKVRPTTGIVRSHPVLNRLHQVYERAPEHDRGFAAPQLLVERDPFLFPGIKC
jgi:hypothetical protein